MEWLAAAAAVPLPTVLSAGTSTSGSEGSAIASPTILGSPVLTAAELAGWFVSTGEISQDHGADVRARGGLRLGGQADRGARPYRFAQSIVETGYFSFPSYGQVRATDNNFAGIGACDSCSRGWSFPDAKAGVGAQLELSEAYASPKPVPTPLIGPVGVGGCCTTWTSLAGTWASSPIYGIAILSVYDQMLSWAIPKRLAVAGLSVSG